MDEIALIESAQRGDLDAFNRLVLAYQELAFNLALRMLNDEASRKMPPRPPSSLLTITSRNTGEDLLKPGYCAWSPTRAMTSSAAGCAIPASHSNPPIRR